LAKEAKRLEKKVVAQKKKISVIKAQFKVRKAEQNKQI